MSEIEFDLLPAQTEMLVSIGACVSKDQARPTLTTVQFTVGNGEVMLAATDSYKLGVIVMDGMDTIDGDGQFIVVHDELVRAIKALREDMKQLPISVRRQTSIQFSFDEDKRTLFVSGNWGKGEVPTFEIREYDATFPSWLSLFNGQPYRAAERMTNKFEGIEGLQFGAFNAEYLGDFNKLLGAKTYRDGSLGITHFSPAGDSPETTEQQLKPWCFASKNAQGTIQVSMLLMPVRT